MSLNSPELYARGYILKNRKMKGGLAHWGKLDFGPWRLLHDPRTPAFEARDGDDIVILLGMTPEPEQEVVDHLITLDVIATQHRLDALAGRYLVIRYSPTAGLRIQQDATGMRPVYYTDPQYPLLIGSHVSLVASVVDAQSGYFGYSDYLKANNLRTYPGRTTGRLGVLRLTPNTELHAETRQVRRVFPTRAVRRRSVAEVAELIISKTHEQLAHLEGKGIRVMSSLTAGLDSRVTLALLRNYKNAHFFTYDIQYAEKNKASEYDLGTAQEIAGRHTLSHQVIEVHERELPADIQAVMTRNTPLNHSRSLAYAYTQQLPADHLHIRSNIYEVGRSYYRAAGYEASDLTANGMLLAASSRKSRDRASIDAFQEFKNTTHFDTAQRRGYDMLDLFYWEHRMGAWMSTILTESDIAHDTHVLVNCREILNATLGLTLDERLSGEVFREVIRRAWPELLDHPINGELMDISRT